MADKEQIKIYVDELPEGCYYKCQFWKDGKCLLTNKKVDAYDCNSKRHSDCPLKTIQSVQNQRVVEALAEAERRLCESHYHEEGEGKYSVYMEEVQSVINQLIKEYGEKND